MKAFLDYYRAHGIIPVYQNITDVSLHLQRRAGLLRQLGVPYRYLTGRSCLEFGPGTGQNALFTLACNPSELILVDANPASLKETHLHLSEWKCHQTNIQLIESTIEAFPTDRKFDFVLCEGVIPFQNNPYAMAAKVGESVSPGGVLVITCVDGVSYFSEILRRTLMPKILALASGQESELETLVRFFTPDLQALPAMSRRYDDWVLDVILHPYRGGKLFPIPDAIDTLQSTFDIQGLSPSFLEDWRWFKQITGDDPKTNEQAFDSYRLKGSALLDYRFEDRKALLDGKILQSMCNLAYERHFDAWDGDREASRDIFNIASKVSDYICRSMPKSAASIQDWMRMFNELEHGKWPVPGAFAGFFGRGQQYVSFIKREHW